MAAFILVCNNDVTIYGMTFNDLSFSGYNNVYQWCFHLFVWPYQNTSPKVCFGTILVTFLTAHIQCRIFFLPKYMQVYSIGDKLQKNMVGQSPLIS